MLVLSATDRPARPTHTESDTPMSENTNPLGDLIGVTRSTLVALIGEQNALANRIKSAGNVSALVAEVRDTTATEDEKILAYRKWMDEVNTAILNNQKAIEEYIKSAGLVDTGDLDVEKATADWKATADKVKAAKGMLKTLGGEDALKDIPEVVGIPGTRAGGSAATGIRRPRFQDISYTVAGTENWVVVSETEGEGAEAKVKTNLTMLGNALSTKEHKVVSKDLQAALYAAAGTEDISTLAGKPVEFAFAVGDVNYIVKVVPRESDN